MSLYNRTAFLNYKSEAKWYYKVGQVLQSRVIFITKKDNNYKVGQYKEKMKETREIDFGNLLFHSTLICLVTNT